MLELKVTMGQGDERLKRCRRQAERVKRVTNGIDHTKSGSRFLSTTNRRSGPVATSPIRGRTSRLLLRP